MATRRPRRPGAGEGGDARHGPELTSAVRASSEPDGTDGSDGAGAVICLETALGHNFSDRTLLARALTHASVLGGRSGESNQRLEFLGDRVLALAIAQELLTRFPDAPEGELARRLTALVRRETCAERALFLGIDRAVRLDRAEAQSGGRTKSVILGDACEAVLAALFLDAGYDRAAAIIVRVWGPLFDDRGTDERDAKSALQERLMARSAPLPTYRLRERAGPDHAPRFVIEVVGEDGVLAAGEGRSKREAEQAAARAALANLTEKI